MWSYIFDQSILDLKYVVIESVDVGVHLFCRTISTQIQVRCHVEFDAEFDDLLHYRWEFISLHVLLRFEICLQYGLQLIHLVITSGAHQRRSHMSGDDCVLPAFGLHALSRIIDDVGIDVGGRIANISQSEGVHAN